MLERTERDATVASQRTAWGTHGISLLCAEGMQQTAPVTRSDARPTLYGATINSGVFESPPEPEVWHRVTLTNLARISTKPTWLSKAAFRFVVNLSTGRDANNCSLLETDLATILGEAPARFQRVSVEAPLEADDVPMEEIDQPLPTIWLSQAYSAVFTPSDQEDIDLPFDPDDYPVS